MQNFIIYLLYMNEMNARPTFFHYVPRIIENYSYLLLLFIIINMLLLKHILGTRIYKTKILKNSFRILRYKSKISA